LYYIPPEETTADTTYPDYTTTEQSQPEEELGIESAEEDEVEEFEE
jgi:hypothetical protein